MSVVEGRPSKKTRRGRGFRAFAAAAREVGVSEDTLRQRVREMDLPTYRDPRDRRQRLLRVSDLEQFKLIVAANGTGMEGPDAT